MSDGSRAARLDALLERLGQAELAGVSWILHPSWIALVRRPGRRGALGQPVAGFKLENVLKGAGP